jgi:hypothetical protein
LTRAEAAALAGAGFAPAKARAATRGFLLSLPFDAAVLAVVSMDDGSFLPAQRMKWSPKRLRSSSL